MEAERLRFEPTQGNVFTFSFGKILKRCTYLDIILVRYREISQEFHTHSLAFLNPQCTESEALRAFQTTSELSPRLHLEVESFFLFAKILLDQVAHAVEFYFGPAQKVSLDSHDGLTKSLVRYARTKNLKEPTGDLIDAAAFLKQAVSDYRDYQIAHEKSPRTVQGTIFDNVDPSKTRISTLKVNPKPSDQHFEHAPLGEIVESIDRYIELMLGWIAANGESSNLLR